MSGIFNDSFLLFISVNMPSPRYVLFLYFVVVTQKKQIDFFLRYFCHFISKKEEKKKKIFNEIFSLVYHSFITNTSSACLKFKILNFKLEESCFCCKNEW